MVPGILHMLVKCQRAQLTLKGLCKTSDDFRALPENYDNFEGLKATSDLQIPIFLSFCLGSQCIVLWVLFPRASVLLLFLLLPSGHGLSYFPPFCQHGEIPTLLEP